MTQTLKVLLVEDSQEDAELLIRELQRGGYKPLYERVADFDSMSSALDHERWDLIMLDHSMPHFNSKMASNLLKDRGIEIPFILVSGTIGEDAAVEAMKAGAKDYIFKGNLKRLVPVVERTLHDAARLSKLKTRVDKITSELNVRAQQQEAVAVIGQLALSGTHPSLLMNDVVSLIASTMNADLSLFLELLSDDRTLVLRAGFGCREGSVGRFALTTEEASEHGFPSLSQEPVVFGDITTEKRYRPLSFLLEHGVTSGLGVSIWGQNRSFGALGVYTKHRRRFTQEDINFLQAVANILAASLDRLSLEKSGLTHTAI